MLVAVTDLELGPLTFGIVGAGRLGLAIARTLQHEGFVVAQASSRSAAGRERATRLLGVAAHEDPLQAAQHVDVVVVCVPDDALASVVGRLAQRPTDASPMQLRVVSTSAAGGIRALDPLLHMGHATSVVHPVASVTGVDEHAPLAGFAAAIGAEDASAATFASAFAHALGMVPFAIDATAWPLHAAACATAANLTTTLLAMADDFAREAHIHPQVAQSAYGKLAASAVDRALRHGAGPECAGPIERGDVAALSQQLIAVRTHAPEHQALFRAGLADAVQRAFGAGHIDMDTAHRLATALADAMHHDVQGPGDH
ncbi:MAG: glycerol-3-phosphate dehydrogenase [Thermoleophilia bacterium]|nr:glycerol-3-phosphate dehydrogenase [Thermoleophilia bacterium]